MEENCLATQQDKEFVVRKIEKTGEQFHISPEASEKLDEYTLLKLYTPVKKYFIREHQAPVCLNLHRTRDGVACMDFIKDSRCPSDFDENRLIDVYLKVVDGYVKSNQDLEEYRRMIRYTIPLLLGEHERSGQIIDPAHLLFYYQQIGVALQRQN